MKAKKELHPSAMQIVRQARQEISKECGFDVQRLGEYYMREQQGMKKVVTLEELDEIARRQESDLSVKPPRPRKVLRSDPIIDEIRAVRKKIWTESDEYPEKFFSYMKKAEVGTRAAGHKIISDPIPASDHDEPIALKEKPARKYGKH
jgi:hypothetical protein